MPEPAIGKGLRRWRAARGLSLRGLAARASVDYTSIVRIEGGRVSPTVSLLARLAKALGTTVPGLFGTPAGEGRKAMEQPRRGRKGQPPRTLPLQISVAARPQKGEIHIYRLGKRPVTVGSNPRNERGHPRLYAMLKDALKQADRWPPEMEEREKRK